MDSTEKNVSFINSNLFFKEFSFSRNNFTSKDGKQLQLADNVIWLDNIFFIYQIKERNLLATGSEDKWFKNKILKKAKNQIKGTLKYFDENKKIIIENERGHKLNVSEAEVSVVKKIIIYNSTSSLNEQLRFLKFYRSKSIQLIHLFHLDDYEAVCNFLHTPAEILEYLSFREELYKKHEQELNLLPEQYVLGHFLETSQTEKIVLDYLKNLKKFENNISDFDVSFIIENFKNRIIKVGKDDDYYKIIKQIAMLDRAELKEFKLRFDLSLKKAESQTFTVPYRMTSVNTACGFVFIPMLLKDFRFWEDALSNLTRGHKYEHKLNKCIGMIVCHNPKEKYYDINWSYIEYDWVVEEDVEKLLRDSYPFRKTTLKGSNRYKLDD